jgi:hypothetical protein
VLDLGYVDVDVGAWGAFRNHPLAWQVAEDLECRLVDVCR